MYSKIIGTGGYLPKKILTNKDLESIVDTTDEWILERTGIKQRHIAEENETTSSMATQASLDAINSAGIKESDIDLIIVATTTPDQIFPSTACIVQNKLNIKAPAFDVQAACTGFIYALSIADNYIKTGMNKNVLVIGAEKYSNLLEGDLIRIYAQVLDRLGQIRKASSDHELLSKVDACEDVIKQAMEGIYLV